jgi:hypothetical protein
MHIEGVGNLVVDGVVPTRDVESRSGFGHG